MPPGPLTHMLKSARGTPSGIAHALSSLRSAWNCSLDVTRDGGRSTVKTNAIFLQERVVLPGPEQEPILKRLCATAHIPAGGCSGYAGPKPSRFRPISAPAALQRPYSGDPAHTALTPDESPATGRRSPRRPLRHRQILGLARDFRWNSPGLDSCRIATPLGRTPHVGYQRQRPAGHALAHAFRRRLGHQPTCFL